MDTRPRPGGTHAPNHLTYRPDIDGLRAIAVLAVMAFHAFPVRVTGGFVGVDVFFVISGFLISGILIQGLDRGSFSFREFYARRIRRIFPALSVVLLVCYVYGWFYFLPRDYEELGKHIASAAGFVANLTSWRESGYFDNPQSKPLLHLWSLGVEEQFYIVWPLILWGLWKTRLNLVACCVTLMVLSAALDIRLVQTDRVAAFYSPVARFWELLIGSCLARFAIRPPRLPGPSRSRFGYAELQSAAGLVCIAAAVLVLKPADAFPGWWAMLPTFGTFLVISAGPTAWLNRRVLAHPILVWIGLISYPLYLWHWPLLLFARQVESTIPGSGLRVAVLLASGALAWLTYTCVERPVRFGVGAGRSVAMLCAVMIAVGLAGYVTYRQNGQAFRYPAGVRALLQYRYDYQIDANPDCWVRANQDFSASCAVESGHGPSLLVWGDSHAGRLFPGLKNVAPAGVALSEFAQNGCPPLVDPAGLQPSCVKGNAYVVETIQRVQPTTVIMFANWTITAGDGARLVAQLAQRLLRTIEELRRRGIQKFVIIGPAPIWNRDLPTLLAQRAVLDAPRYRIPDRLNIGLGPDARTIDVQFEPALGHLPSVRYVSLLKLLCDADGCLTHVPQSPMDLITFDNGHLTTAGAELVARHLGELGVFDGPR